MKVHIVIRQEEHDDYIEKVFSAAPDAPIANSACMVEWHRGGNMSLTTFVKCFIYANNSFYIGSFSTGTTPTSITWKLVTTI